MTEENERPGNAVMPGVQPAGAPGARSVPAAPSAVPPKPSAPPTSATPVVPHATPPSAPLATLPAAPPTPLPARPSAPPVNGPDAGQPRSRRAGRAPGAAGTPNASAAKARTAGTAAAATAALAGAGKVASAKTSQLGGWVRRQSAARIGAAVAAVVVMGLLIWGVTSLGGSPQQPAADVAPAAAGTSAAPASRGPLPLEGVGPLDFQPGDCFKDFDPEAPQSTIVDCTTGHSAQLIAVHHYQAPDTYPGLDALKDKGRETCRSAQLAAAATTYNLLQRNAYPSSSSWDKGDRRVDCYVTADAGNVIMESLVP